MEWVLNQMDFGTFALSLGYEGETTTLGYEDIENIVINGKSATLIAVIGSMTGQSYHGKICIRIYPYEGLGKISIGRTISISKITNLSTSVTHYYNGEETTLNKGNPIIVNSGTTYIDLLIEGDTAPEEYFFDYSYIVIDFSYVYIHSTIKRGRFNFRDGNGNKITLADIGNVGDSALRYRGDDGNLHKIYLTDAGERNTSDFIINVNGTDYHAVKWDN